MQRKAMILTRHEIPDPLSCGPLQTCGYRILKFGETVFLDPPNVALLRALWSLLDGNWGVLKGSWGVLVVGICWCARRLNNKKP